MEILDLTSITSDDLRDRIGDKSIAVLAGSGISLWQPTNLPTGQELTETIFDLLFRSGDLPQIAVGDLATLDEFLPDLPFEAVMERCPAEDKLRQLIFELFGGPGNPNPVHEALAMLVSSGVVSSITTTNYDLGQDAALHAAEPTMQFVVSRPPAIRALKTYFKIHGSAEPGCESTLVYSLRLEGALAPWKRNLLASLFSNRTLLILGYSGLDFEVCPEIPATQPANVIWNFFKREDLERSPGLKRLIAAGVKVTAVIGDMRDLLGPLTGAAVPVERSTLSHRKELEALLRERFTTDDLLLWRARVLNSMACTRLARQALEALKPTENPNWLVSREYADSWHHAGAYKSSAKWYRHAAQLSSNDMTRRSIMLAESDAVRCYGRWRKAKRIIDTAMRQLDSSMPDAKSVRALELLKRTLIQRHWIRLYQLLRMYKSANRSRDLVIKWIKEGKDLAIANGLWYDFQQFRFWSERLGLADDEVRSVSYFEPPPSRQGYQQLGYQLALIMSKRDRAWAEFRSGTLTTNTVDEIKKCFCLIEVMGSHSEAWKLARLLFNATRGKERWRYGKAFLHHFFSCEYALTKRPFFLVLGDFSSR